MHFWGDNPHSRGGCTSRLTSPHGVPQYLLGITSGGISVTHPLGGGSEQRTADGSRPPYATAVRSNCMIMILTTYPTMPYMHIAGRRHLSQLLQPRSPLDSISDGVQHARQSSDSVAWSYCELMRSVCCRWRDVHDRHLHVSPLLDHWVDGRRGIRRASYRIGGHHFTTKMLPACRICGSIRV